VSIEEYPLHHHLSMVMLANELEHCPSPLTGSMHIQIGKQEVICIGDSAPVESWGDSSENCLHDMHIVGNA
jgi:hypothetical protein